jgi:polyphosphate kinase
MTVLESHPFHVTRDADLDIQELEAEDLLETIEESVRLRRFGSVIRLKVHRKMPQHLLSMLMQHLEVNRRGVYRVNGLLGLSRLMSVYRLDRPDLKYTPFLAATPEALKRSPQQDMFAVVRQQDVLIHHPFESFDPVIEFLSRAAHDPDVLAIKIVLYRVGRNSPIVKVLLEAIEEDKQVAVLMELKARFDEESNIEWARALEHAGVHVVYGLLGLKSHCKIALVVRREGDRIRRYVHLGTGNYNAITACLYTDLGLFTADEQIAEDASDLFNFLTGYSHKRDYRSLLISPITLREGLEVLIDREINHCRAGSAGRIIFKMNSLVDGRMIRRLYEASRAGVEIDLLVRGICCLRPGVPGVSENIRVTSIVGRFLEHSRIYYFGNGGSEELYLGSADLMPRNLDRRVEILFPVNSPELRTRIRSGILDVYLADNVKARRMMSDGSYVRVRPKASSRKVDAQMALLPSSK